MRFFYRIYLIFAYYFAVTVFLIVSFCLNLLCLIVGWIPGSIKLYRSLRTFLQFLFRRWAWFMGFIRVLNLQTPPKTLKKVKDGEIWVLNHPSLLDGSYMLKFITNGFCIYKREIGGNPFYGATAKLANYIPNMGGADMVRMACAALKRGEDLVVFPEGTRSTKINLDNFRPGFALIAKRSKALINVMSMESPDDFMTRNAPFWKVPELTAHITISQINQIDPIKLKSVEMIVEEVKRSYQRRLI
jgi:1-acyl-sn-glycerol-3-phosphate acyltransferase